MRVGLVVGLVPALRLRHRRPALDLAPLGLDARQAVVEHPRHAVLDGEHRAAAAATQPGALVLERAAADRAAQQLEQRGRHGHDVLCTGKDGHTRA